MDCKSDEMHADFLCILFYITLTQYVSGAICIGAGCGLDNRNLLQWTIQHTITITRTYVCTLQFVP
jgi:hypothetical protein